MIFFLPQMRGLHVITDIAQTNGACLILQFAIAIGGACQAIEWMVGDIKLHHAFAQFCQMRGLRAHNHAGFNWGRATRRGPSAAIDFDQAQAA